MVASEIADLLNQTISGIDKVIKAKQLLKPGSLVELSQASRVTAPCVYDQHLYFSDSQSALVDTIRTCENMYTGFYLLALNSVMTVGKIDIDKTLGRLNPKRNGSVLQAGKKLILESADGKDLVMLDDKKPQEVLIGTDKDDIKILNDNANIVTGKYLNVTLTDGDAIVKMPISIGLRLASTNATVLEGLLSTGGNQNSMRTRWHRMMAGELSFWDDIIWSSDLIKQQKKLMRMDKDGIIRAVQTARVNAMKAAAATGVPSSGVIAATYIISSDSATRLERTIGRPLSNFAVRQKLMEESLAMQLAIIDPREEMVTFYFHSIAEETTVSFRMLEKSGKKNDGSDLLAILQALRTGNVPQIR